LAHIHGLTTGAIRSVANSKNVLQRRLPLT
jgi:hypothetical protein